MSFLRVTFPKVLKTSLIISLVIYIPLSLVNSITNVDDRKKKAITPKQIVVQASLKEQK